MARDIPRFLKGLPLYVSTSRRLSSTNPVNADLTRSADRVGGKKNDRDPWSSGFCILAGDLAPSGTARRSVRRTINGCVVL